ncbi:MAG: hypothetical protein MJ252_01730, partial [archaeon]|nr:hypothetical protein [archaeon]
IEEGIYYVTLVDACGEETLRHESLRISLIGTSNLLKSIGPTYMQIGKTTNNCTVEYYNGFSSSSVPKKIEFVHSTGKDATTYGVSYSMITQYFSGDTSRVGKLNVDTTNAQPGLFRVRTTYGDNSVELSMLTFMVFKNVLQLEKDYEIRELGDSVSEVDITFKESLLFEQISTVTYKTFDEDLTDKALGTPCKYKKTGDKTIHVTFPHPVAVTTNISVIIDDYGYSSNLFYNITYKQPENYKIGQEVYLVNDQDKVIDIDISIIFEDKVNPKDFIKKFWVKGCCDNSVFEQLPCQVDTEKEYALVCKYKKNVDMISPTAIIIQYLQGQIDIPLLQKKIYINPTVQTYQEYRNLKAVQDQMLLTTHCLEDLYFYLDEKKLTKTDLTSQCEAYYNAYLTYGDLECPKEGYFDLRVGLIQNTTYSTFIRKVLCIFGIDIKNIPEELYTAKEGLQDFTGIFNKTIPYNYITNIIFKRQKNGDTFESEKCKDVYQTAEGTTTVACKINLEKAVQGEYDIYYRYADGTIEKSDKGYHKYLKTIRDLTKAEPFLNWAYENSKVTVTFNVNVDINLVNAIALYDSKNTLYSKILLPLSQINTNDKKNYQITIPKDKFLTGYYTFRVLFKDNDDSFDANKNVKIFILEKQIFKPEHIVLIKNTETGNISLKIEHVKTTVEIKEVQICGTKITTQGKFSTYSGKAFTCTDLVPKYKIDAVNYPLNMTFAFIITTIPETYIWAGVPGCIYYKTDSYKLSLTAYTNITIDLNTLAVAFYDKSANKKINIPYITDKNNHNYREYSYTPSAEDKKTLLNGKWQIVIVENEDYAYPLLKEDVSFTDLYLPEYIMRLDESISFTNAKCALTTNINGGLLEGRFDVDGYTHSVYFTKSTLSGNSLTLTMKSALSKFTKYGYGKFYIKGASEYVNGKEDKLFVSNTLKDSSFTVQPDKTEKIRGNLMTVSSPDYYLLLLTKFSLKNKDTNEEFENTKIVSSNTQLPSPSTYDLSFVRYYNKIEYLHDTFNYHFEITKFTDKRNAVRTFISNYLIYEGPDYVPQYKTLNDIFFIPAETERNQIIYIPLEIINNGDKGLITIDGNPAICEEMTEQDKDNLRLTGDKYALCRYKFSYIKQLEITYDSNPCSKSYLILGKYSIAGPECIVLGHEELTPYPTYITLETPKVEGMNKLNVVIGTNNPTSVSISDESIQYSSFYEFAVISESPNYDYMVQLSTEGKSPIYLDSVDAKIYKYIDMKSVSGTIQPGNKEVKLTVTLAKAITKADMPLIFFLDSTQNRDAANSKGMTLLEGGKAIEVTFDLTGITSTEFLFGYIMGCNKEVDFPDYLRASSSSNFVTAAKYDKSTLTVTLTFAKATNAYGKPDKVILGGKEYTLTQKSMTQMTFKVDESLSGRYLITTVYGKNKYEENAYVIINGKRIVKPTIEGKEYSEGYSEKWMELTMNENAFDGLFMITYQRYQGDGETILESRSIAYTVDNTNRKILRLYTEGIVYNSAYKYTYVITDLSAQVDTFFTITVKGGISIKVDKHFYKSGTTVSISASGVDGLYSKLIGSNKYKKIEKSGNYYVYHPESAEEQLEIYYTLDGGKTLKLFGERIFIYSKIEDILEISLEDCVYTKVGYYDMTTKAKSGIDMTYLKFTFNDVEVTSSYRYYYTTGTSGTYKIADGNNVLYTKTISFTDFSVTSFNLETKNGKITIPISATCAIKGLIIKGIYEYPLTCDKSSCTFEPKDGDSKYIIYYGTYAISRQIIITYEFSYSTILITYPEITPVGQDFKVYISSDNYDVSKITAVDFVHGNSNVVKVTNLVMSGNSIIITVKLESASDTITKIILYVGTLKKDVSVLIKSASFIIIADGFYSMKTERLAIKLSASINGSMVIKSAKTDKGLTFGGATCEYNKVCLLALNKPSDYSKYIGKNILTIEYEGGSTTLSEPIFIRYDDPKVTAINLLTGGNVFIGKTNWAVEEEYYKSGAFTIQIVVQSGEYKCQVAIDSGDKTQIYLTCPVTIKEDAGYFFKTYFGDIIETVNYTLCAPNQVVINGKCSACQGSTYYYSGKCYSSCPSGTFELNKICYTRCPNYSQEGKCVAKCSNGYGLASSAQTNCYKCSSNNQVFADGYCYNECPAGFIFDSSKKECIIPININYKVTLDLEGYCKNDGKAKMEGNTLTCTCLNGYVGTTCTYKKEESSLEKNRLKQSIFALGAIGDDGQIKAIAPIDYNSGTLLNDLGDLIELFKADKYDMDQEEVDTVLSQVESDISKYVNSYNQNGTALSEVEKQNLFAIITFTIDVTIQEGRRRRLTAAEEEKLNKIIELLKKLADMNAGPDFDQNSAIVTDSRYGDISIYSYTSKEESLKALKSLLANRSISDGDLLFVLSECFEKTDTINFIRSDLLDAVKGIRVGDKDLSACHLKGYYRTNLECDTTYTPKVSTMDLTQFENKGIDLYDPYDPAFVDKCFITPDPFEFDITQKFRKNVLFQGGKLKLPPEMACEISNLVCEDKSVQIDCAGGDLPKSVVLSSAESANFDKTVYNVVFTCSNFEGLSSNSGLIFTAILIVILIIGGVLALIGEIKEILGIKNIKKLAHDGIVISADRVPGEYIPGQGKGPQEKTDPNANPARDVTIETGSATANDIGSGEKSFGKYLLSNLLRLHPITACFYQTMITSLALNVVFLVAQIMMFFGFNAVYFSETYIEDRIFDADRDGAAYPLKKEFVKIILSLLSTVAVILIARLISFVTTKSFEGIKVGTVESIKTFFRENLIRRIVSAVFLGIAIGFFGFCSISFCNMYPHTSNGWAFSGIWTLLLDYIILAPIYIIIISGVECKAKDCALVMKKLFCF